MILGHDDTTSWTIHAVEGYGDLRHLDSKKQGAFERLFLCLFVY